MAKTFDVRKQTGFTLAAFLCFTLLYLPIILLIVYSFNAGRTISVWEGFSLRWYLAAWQNEQVQDATLRSLWLALVSSSVAIAVAVSAAMATTRVEPWRGQGLTIGLINQPLMVPEIVTAVGLLIFFSAIKVATGFSGMIYVVIAHTAFCIPFAYMPVRARLQGMDLSLERAAADLYARPTRAFYYVTLPQLWPGVFSGWMLAFVISLDNVVITEFVKSAGQETLPTYLLGQMRRQMTPEINAISAALLLISILLVIATYLSGRKKV